MNSDTEVSMMKDYKCVIGDARDIPFIDNSFDLVFSNSVIEHVGNFDDMARFASACERVGRELYIQTPNRWFPIEPHIVAVFIHWLPERIYRRLAFLSLRRLSLRNDKPKFYCILDGINLISRSKIRALFPNRIVQAERFFGLAKSFIVADRKVV